MCHGEPFCAEFFEEDDFLGVEIGDKKDDIEEDDDSLTVDQEKPRGYILLHFNHGKNIDFNKRLLDAIIKPSFCTSDALIRYVTTIPIN